MVAVPQNAVSRVIGIETAFKNLRGGIKLLPMRIAVIGQGATSVQGSYTTDKRRVLSAKEAGDTFGYGSPVHLTVDQLLPANGDGVGIIPVTVYPLKDNVSGIVAAGSITPIGVQTQTQTYRILVNKIPSQQFTILKDAVVADATAAITAAINAVIGMPIIAVDNTTDVGITAKWKGESGNDIIVEVEGTIAGINLNIVQPTGGAVNPDITTATDQIANIWETLIVNCLNISDTNTLDAFNDFFEPRWGPTIKKPGIVFVTSTETDVATAIVTAEAKKTYRTICQLDAPGSLTLPFINTARSVARIAVVANDNPPLDYAGQQINGIVPGTDAEQWNYLQREVAVVGGISTIEVIDNVIELSDTVTFYHPIGEDPPAYRYVNDLIKVMNVLFNLALIFESDDWKGKVLIPDDQPTINKEARKPKNAVTAISNMIDSLALNAIISNPETAKKTIVAIINPGNNRRLDVEFTYQISGNTTILSITANFGFYFGTQLAA